MADQNSASLCLPDIDINISGDPRTFLSQMSEIGRAHGQFDVEEYYDALGSEGDHVANFRYRGESSHDQPGGQLIARRDCGSVVAVEMHALRWEREALTRGIFCEAAKSIMGPLLSAYNRKFGTHYRFRIEKPSRKGSVLTQRTEYLFRRFALLANTSSLHVLDWCRFYGFVLGCRQNLTEALVRQLLVEHGFSAAKAEHISEVYSHLVDFKNYSANRYRR